MCARRVKRLEGKGDRACGPGSRGKGHIGCLRCGNCGPGGPDSAVAVPESTAARTRDYLVLCDRSIISASAGVNVSGCQGKSLYSVLVCREVYIAGGRRVIDGSHIQCHRIGRSALGSAVIHLEPEGPVWGAFGVLRTFEHQKTGVNISPCDHLVQRHIRTVQLQSAGCRQRSYFYALQGVSGIHVAEIEVAGCKGQVCVLVHRKRIVTGSRRVVDSADIYIEGKGCGISMSVVIVIYCDRYGCGAVPILAALELQAAQEVVNACAVAL